MIPVKPDGVKWTDDQWQAIYARNNGLLLSAAAGSGKTAVLIERILQRLQDEKDPVDVDQLLVTTFTDAAAAEMRHRLRDALEKAVREEEEKGVGASRERIRQLRKQITLLPRATISTMHSFCKSVLQKYFYRIGLDPSFRVASETDLNVLRQEVMEEVLDKAYAEQPEHSPFRQMVDVWGGRSDDRAIAERVFDLYEQARSQPWPTAWMESLASDYGKGDLGRWLQSVTVQVLDQLDGMMARIRQAIPFADRPDGPFLYIEILRDDLEKLAQIRETFRADFDAGINKVTGHKWSDLPRKKMPDCNPDLKERVQQARSGWKEKFNKWSEQMMFFAGGAAKEDVISLAPVIRGLVDLTKAYDAAFSQAKAAKSWIDFSDLEHLSLKILCTEASDEQSLFTIPSTVTPTEAALELRSQLKEVMIDEYQDTNRVQETMIELLTSAADRNGNPGAQRFMVGDVKQSIYRFRLAEPGLFLDHESAYLSGKGGERIVLSQNFRSRPDILHAVNGLFRQLMTGGSAEIVYDSHAELKPGLNVPEWPAAKGQTAARTELVILEPASAPETGTGEDPDLFTDAEESNAEEDGPAETSSASEGQQIRTGDLAGIDEWQQWPENSREARWIAGRIREWMALDDPEREPLRIFDPKLGAERPVKFSDFVILLRTMSTHSTTMVETLRSAGIPADADVRENWFEAPEVLSTLALLEVLDNRKQDIPLAAVLRSGYFSWNEAALAAIRIGRQDMPYHEAFEAALSEVQQQSSSGSGDFQSNPDTLQLIRTGQLLRKWSEARHHQPVETLLWSIWEESGYYVSQAALQGGAQRQANLRAMTDMAAQADRMGEGGIYSFIQRVRRMRRNNEPVGAARVADEQGDVVRVMSIHKSKGLEFPVVFVARMTGFFNQMDNRAPFSMHRDLGCGSILFDPQRRTSRLTLPLLAIRNRLKLEQLAEELRVLYVALTRARDHLVLVASPKIQKKAHAAWRGLTTSGDPELPFDIWSSARSYWDWLAPCLIRHRDAVPLREWLDSEEPAPGCFRPDDEGHWRLTRVTQAEQGTLRDAPDEAAIAEVEPDAERTTAEGTGTGNAGRDDEAFPQDAAAYLRNILSWKDPMAGFTRHFAKVSVSFLKKHQTNPADGTAEFSSSFRWELPDSPELPDSSSLNRINNPVMAAGGHSSETLRKNTASEDPSVDGRARGTAVHRLMQRIDLSKDWDAADAAERLNQWIRSEADAGRLDQLTAKSVDAVQLLRFLQSEAGLRLRNAQRVWREQPFSLLLPSAEVYPELDGGHVLVQGIIDVMWLENGSLVIADYKTDRFSGTPDQDIRNRIEDYKQQVSLYRRAVQEATGKPVSETILYFLETGEVITV